MSNVNCSTSNGRLRVSIQANTTECCFDGGYCVHDGPVDEAELCFQSCNASLYNFDQSLFGDHICYPRYNTQQCCYDNGDCVNNLSNANVICPTCHQTFDLSNSYCNLELNTNECCFDSGDCYNDRLVCSSCGEEDMSWFRDSHCDDKLNNPACCFDGGDCPCPTCPMITDVTPTKQPYYAPAIGNLQCDKHLDTEECCHDGFDCSYLNK